MVAKPSANALPSATFAAMRVMVVRFIGGPISLGMLRPNGIDVDHPTRREYETPCSTTNLGGLGEVSGRRGAATQSVYRDGAYALPPWV